MRPIRWITGLARWPFRAGCIFAILAYLLVTGAAYSFIARMLSVADTEANFAGALLLAGWLAVTASFLALLFHVYGKRKGRKA